MTLELPDGTSFVFDAELCDAIVPDQCIIAINRANVEIKLKKARSGQWANLEAKPGAVVNPWPDTSSTSPSSSSSFGHHVFFLFFFTAACLF